MPEQGSSFIPKAGAGPVRRTKSVRRVYLLGYISNIVFFSVLFAVIGIYIYAALIDRNLEQLKTELDSARTRFSVTDIEQVKSLDRHLSTATQLLEDATAPSRIFSDVEQIVADNIVFSAMVYTQLPNKQFELTLTGRADDFNQIIKQNEVLRESNLLSGAKVTALDYSIAGDETTLSGGEAVVTFVFSDTRNISSISYQPPVTDTATNDPSSVEVLSDSSDAIIDNATSTGTSTTVVNPDSSQ